MMQANTNRISDSPLKTHDFWHPVLRLKDLNRRPVKANFCGREIVIFRGQNGQLGALDDCCPHRKMRLSKGKIQENRLVCPYHGWSYDSNGKGVSPGNPKMRPCANSYDIAERYGAIWVKKRSSSVEIPEVADITMKQVCVLHYRIKAPLLIVLDNFVEIEHSCTTHLMFGHDTQGIASVESHMKLYENSIQVFNKGTQKRMLWPLEKLLRISRKDLFVGKLLIKFSPVQVHISNYWLSPDSEKRRPGGAEGAIVLNPVSKTETEAMVFSFFPANTSAFRHILKPIVTFFVDYETKLDIKALEAIADKNPDLSEMQLGRFDRPLSAIRDYTERLYWSVSD
jgi:vanillate O-demethylase monooxygenase subunit